MDPNDRERLESITRRLRAIGRAAVELTAAHDASRVVDAAAAALARDLDAALAQVWLVAPDAPGELVLRCAAGPLAPAGPPQPVRLDVATDTTSVALAARTRRPVPHDPGTGTELFPDGRTLDGGVGLALPLVAGDALQGVLAAAFMGPLPAETSALLEAFAASLAVALHDADLLAREQRARGQAERSEQRFVDLVDGLDHAIVWEADPATMRFSFVSARTPPQLLGLERDAWLEDPAFWDTHVPPEDRARVRDAVALALRTGKSQTVEHRMIRADGSPQWVHTGLRIARDEATGRPTLHGITVDASHLELTAELQERRMKAEALRADVSAALAEARELTAMLQRCAQAIVENLGAAFARFWLLEPDSQELVLRASAGRYTHLDGAHARMRLGEKKIGRIAATRRPMVTNDAQHDPVIDAEWAAREGIVSFAGYPLVAEERVVGVVALFGTAPLSVEAVDSVAFAADAIAQGILRLRAEAALREGEARLRLALEATGLGTWEWDERQRVLRVCERAMGLLGVEGPTVTREQLLAAAHPDDRAALDRALTAAHEPDTSGLSIELRFRLDDEPGRHRWVALNGVTMFARHAGERRAERIIGTALDVTASRRAAANARLLAEAGRQLARTLDYDVTLRRVARLAVPYLADYCLVDLFEKDGPPCLVAAACTTSDEVEQAVRQLRAAHPLPADVPFGVRRVFRTGEPERRTVDAALLELVGRHAPEHRRLMEEAGIASYMVLPLSVRGRTLGTLTLLSAESGHRYDADDEALAEELARRIALAIDNARLYREAQDAIRARDEFLSIASHELRTPLTPLQLQVQSLRRMADKGELPPERLRQKLEVAERQVERLGKLVANLLDISRITAHRLLLEPEDVDLAALVRDLVERSRDHLSRAGCTVDLRAPDALVGRWDRMRLEQVFTNLLSNALNYGAGKPIEVRLEAEGDHARLTVRDHGIGIAPEDQRRIFQRFERAVSERHYGGFGLGLWICRQVVEAMGGTIAVASALGRGATFTVRLPLATPVEAA